MKALVGILLVIAAAAQAKEYELLKKGHYCKGPEPYKKYQKSISSCGNACRGVSEFFIYGTNEFGTKRCNKNGCRCYCEQATEHQCVFLTGHKGYDLYKYSGNGHKKVADGQYCKGKEPYMGVKKTLSDCAAACKGKTHLFIYGTNAHGTKRCYGNKGCRCYCEATTHVHCKKLTVHLGYNLYKLGPKPTLTIGKDAPKEIAAEE